MTPQEFQCDCEKCQAMCAHSTCLPTPAEARELVRSGFGDRLATYQFRTDKGAQSFVGPSPVDSEGWRNLPSTRLGPCTFYKAGKCELHPLGLKPLEGRMAHHDLDWLPIRQHVASHWRGKQFESVLSALERNEATT